MALSRNQEIFISLAGPFAGFLFAALIILLVSLGFSSHYISAFFTLLVAAIPFSMLVALAECRCYALTALGRYKLGALKRNDALQSTLATLTPLIIEAQKKEPQYKEEPAAGAGPSEVL